MIIFLINNHGYTIEVEIHDGPTTISRTGTMPGRFRCSMPRTVMAAACARQMVENWRKPSKWDLRTVTGRR